MAKTLKLAANLLLPIETVTQTIAILAKRRAGKSYTMRRIVEQLFKAGQQVVLVDPKGDQWGLRSSVDGKSPGLPIVIFGGERGDVPLEVGAGELVAKLVVEDRVSALLDLSLFRKREVATFMTAFLESLYRLKAREAYRTPVMLVIDEADAIAPQKPQDGEERMLGAAEDIVRRGGQRGLGCILVTQRSAVLNKNVLTQAEMLIALRTIAPQDLKAMNEWIDVHGTPEQRKTLMESLPSLPIGDAWFWSPGWPTGDGIFQRVHVLPIETFDSGASPKPGVKPIEVKTLADVDIEAVKGQMAHTLERAKAEDPKELKRQLGQASVQLAASTKRISELEARVSRTSGFSSSNEKAKKEQPALTDADRAQMAKLGEVVSAAASMMSESLVLANDRFRNNLNLAIGEYTGQVAAAVAKAEKGIAGDLAKVKMVGLLEKIERLSVQAPKVVHQNSPAKPRETAPRGPVTAPVRKVVHPSAAGPRSGEGLTKAEQKVVDAVAWWMAAGIEAPTRHQVAFVAGYTVNGHFNNMVGGLRTKGLVDYPQGGGVFLTPDGSGAANIPDGDIDFQELVRRVLAVLEPSPGRIFKAVAEANRDLTRDELAQLTGYTVNGHFNNMVGSLRSLGVIQYPQQGGVRLGKMFEALR